MKPNHAISRVQKVANTRRPIVVPLSAGDAATLKTMFADIEKFWTARKADDAIGFAKTGAKSAADLETAAKAKNEEGVATAARAVNGTCMGCHAAHRERLPDGSSEIK